MPVYRNFMVKVEEAKLVDIQKAVEQAGIKIRSIIEVYKEDKGAPEAAQGSSSGEKT